jgi:heme/copper-type cytochrome/quinol oxidase subunit 3
MRIARASAINLPLITGFGLIAVATRATGISQSAKLGLFITIPVFGVAFTILAIFSWHRLMSAHFRLVKSSYEGAKSKETLSPASSNNSMG